MKTNILWMAVMAIWFLAACQEEKAVELSNALDLDLSLEILDRQDLNTDYIQLSLKNTSSASLTLPDGIIVFEVRSISGGVVTRFPLRDQLVDDEHNWNSCKDFTLEPHEVYALRIPVGKILDGDTGEGSVALKEAFYTLNAFITKEKNPGKFHNAAKIRSNFLDLKLDDNPRQLSYNGM